MSKNLEYFYYPPVNPQFFFPRSKFKRYRGFYTPYSIESKFFWFLFRNSNYLRLFFKVNQNKIPLPVATIKRMTGLEESEPFFNLGTKGIEQKATIVVNDGNNKRFLKFAERALSRKLVINEAEVLLGLEKQSVIKTAKVISFVNDPNFICLTTELIVGEKFKLTKLNNRVFGLLSVLPSIYPNKDNGTIEVFSHGDFCPWNILIDKQQDIVLIDWEMSGYKPLGYDLFTYIFQTNFLLHPKKEVNDIVSENKTYIDKYFERYKVNYREYLIQFASLKVKDEENKANSKLLEKYKLLLQLHDLQ